MGQKIRVKGQCHAHCTLNRIKRFAVITAGRTPFSLLLWICMFTAPSRLEPPAAFLGSFFFACDTICILWFALITGLISTALLWGYEQQDLSTSASTRRKNFLASLLRRTTQSREVKNDNQKTLDTFQNKRHVNFPWFSDGYVVANKLALLACREHRGTAWC